MVLLDLIKKVGPYFHPKYIKKRANIDSFVFKLHYHTTTGLLFVFSLLVTADRFIGKPIVCQTQIESIKRIINDYCWIMSTFVLTTGSADIHGVYVIPNYSKSNNTSEQKRFHIYYKWIPFALGLQGILFYLPHWLWKLKDGKLVEDLTDSIRGLLPIEPVVKAKQIKYILQYLVENKCRHYLYGLVYILCELLNFVNVVSSIFVTDRFLGGGFLTYGIDVILFYTNHNTNSSNPMTTLFPKVGKCSYYNFGYSGTAQIFDAICFLNLNVFHEIIYLLLWFWLVVLTLLSGLSVIYFAVLYASIPLRLIVLKRRFHLNLTKIQIRIICHMQFGDYLLFYLIGKNLSRSTLQQITDNWLTTNNDIIEESLEKLLYML